MRKKRDVSHLIYIGSRPDIGQGHFAIRSRLTFTQEEIDLIGFGGIIGVLLGGDDRKAAIDALRASTTMGMQHRHVVNAGAASRVSDQIAAPISRYPFDDIRFC